MLKLIYDDKFVEDMSRVPHSEHDKIETAIQKKLGYHPELFGVKLRGILKDYWKLRVGDYRVAFIPKKEQVIIKAVGNRKDFYKILERRIR